MAGDQILSLDPSSKATGWALTPIGGGDHTDAGVLRRPSKWPAYLRVRCMHEDAATLIDRVGARVARVVVEVPGDAQAGRMRSEYSTSGVYAASVGAVLAACWAGFTGPVVTVESDHWTRHGRGFGVAKSKRIAALKLQGRYDDASDAGGDMADAIMLGAWYADGVVRWEGSECSLHLPEKNVGRRPFAISALHRLPDGTLSVAGSNWRP